jgi:hypothetical protein
MPAYLICRGVDGDAATDEAADFVALAQKVDREGQDGLHLRWVGFERELRRVGYQPDEGVNSVAGDEGGRGGKAAAQLDRRRVEGNLLVSLAQGRCRQVGVTRVPTSSRKRDLSRMAAQVCPALGEDEPWLLRPAVQWQQDGRVDRLTAQMITWTVPPSTDQAAPLT